jgi:hypothetical protein
VTNHAPIGRALRRAAGRLAAGIGLAVLALQPSLAGASETDQYTLPVGREFADLRLYFSRTVYTAIVEAVNEANAGTPDASGNPQRLHSPDGIAAKVWERLYIGFSINEAIDGRLGGAAARSRYPGFVVAYRPEEHLYDHPLLTIDVTKFVRTFFRSSTVNVNGTLLGTDKIVHWVHMGHLYYISYRGARLGGATEADAVARAVGLSSGSNIFLSESALLGLWVTGIRSNADLAANYSGFKFYRNLTEPVAIGARVLPPMLVRDGDRWRIDGRVRPDSDFFTVFVTPHWNEALNPNTYIALVDTVVQSMLRRRCADVLDWYRDERGRRRDREQFAALARELATFYGEPYGHQDDGDRTVSIANTCFPAGQPASASTAGSAGSGVQSAPAPRGAVWSAAPAWPGGDQLGRTELWWAARDGQLAAVERLLAQVENPNAADIDGEGPLHAAARRGHVAVVEVLLASGADPGARALDGATPLHAAVGQSEAGTALALLRKGADVNARDAFGRTPLHQAALQGNRELAALLLDYGADSAVAYAGRTPAQLAMRAGDQALADWLVSYRPTRVARSTAVPEPQARPKDYVPLPRMPAKPGPRKVAQPVS